jgi:hypothetical protein
MFYDKKDFVDYSLMIALSATVLGLSYGTRNVMSYIGFALCAFLVVTFAIRHKIDLSVPLLLRRPQDALYMLAYKIRNLKAIYFVALGILLLENVLIAKIPGLPHHVEAMRKLALYLFYIHFILITGFRTVMLFDHLAKRELVREVLMQTPWKRVIKKDTNITLEIVHAYSTGVLTHIILLVPWYLVIRYCRFSLVLFPVVCVVNIVVHQKWYRVFNEWFYRDHWLGHNSEFEFIFLHGTHHDAIPSGMIAVAENGLLEGVSRCMIGAPVAFYNPLISFLAYTIEVAGDMRNHQYIPGMFPRLSRRELEILHHATHHYGPLEPYSIGIGSCNSGSPDMKKTTDWIPEAVRDSIRLDRELTGFDPDSPVHRRLLNLYDRYQTD